MKSIPFLAILLAAGVARAQVPGMFPWWERPIAREIGLTEEQDTKVRTITRDFRPKLIQLRAQVETAEAELKDEMNEPQVDTKKATAAIEKVVEARAALTREITLMSLKLRMVLTAAQWQELQKREPRPKPPQQGPPRDPARPGPLGEGPPAQRPPQ